MTNDLPADEFLQVALNAAGLRAGPSGVRNSPGSYYKAVIAHARTLEANAKLQAELDALRAKYEPVDLVELAVEDVLSSFGPGEYVDGYVFIEAGIRRGMEMQPAPFTPDEADRIARAIFKKHELWRDDIIFALTTPRADLAKMGEG